MDFEKRYEKMDILVPLMEESISKGKDVKFTVSGNSMYPMLRHRADSVILEKVEKLKKYDIPLYRRENGEYVLHRIIKIKDGCFHIAGDNEIKLEYPVKSEQVIAVVKGFYRKGKYYSKNNGLYRIYILIWCMILPYRYKILPILLRLRYATGGCRAKKQK